MCGRFVVAGAATDLVAQFDVDLPAENLPAASWNVAPTDRVPIVIDTIPKGSEPDAEPVRRLEAARWGLVPAWAKDVSVGVKAINARIESVREKPQFKNAVAKRRAIVPATGYYEWKLVDGVKTPNFIHLPDGELLVFAGLYEWWRNPAIAEDSPDKWLLSTTILTQDAAAELAGIHDRMPVFLDPALIDEWLEPGTDGTDELLGAVAACGIELAHSIEFHEVDRAVGNVRNNSPQLIEAI